MQLMLLIDANPRAMREASGKVWLREGKWKIETLGVVSTKLGIYHTLGSQDTQLIPVTEDLVIEGPAYISAFVITPGQEKSITAFATRIKNGNIPSQAVN